MEKVRGKFTCTKNVPTEYGNEVSFWSLYSNNPEDNSYSKATPYGQITMSVTSDPAKEFFIPGQAYYLDFSRCE